MKIKWDLKTKIIAILVSVGVISAGAAVVVYRRCVCRQ
jgi:hypothetical protein